MPAFTIHDLYTSMGGNVSPEDFRNKQREAWTTYDWLNALSSQVTGVGGSPDDRRIWHNNGIWPFYCFVI